MNAFILKDGPEIRTYSSPTYENVLQDSLVIYLNKYESQHLKEYKKRFHLKQVDITDYEKNVKRPLFRLVEILFYGVKKRYKVFRGEQEYSHMARKQKKIQESKLFSILLYIPFFLLARIYDNLSLKKNLHLSELEHYQNIKTLYITAYNKHYLNIILNIKELNPKVHVICILHSEKDLFVDSYIPDVCDELHLWKASNLSYLKKTYPFFKNKVELIGVPRFKALKSYIDSHKRESTKGVNIMYICAHPYIVKDEFKIIQELIRMTASLYKEISWTIRLNPMNQEMKKFEELISYHVEISYPKWEWNEEKFFNMPSFQAEEDFFKAIVDCDIFIGGVSTVAFEGSINRKRYLAITFDDTGKNEKLSTLLDSGIYDKNIQCKQICVCKDKEKLLDELTTIVDGNEIDVPFDKLNQELLSNEY